MKTEDKTFLARTALVLFVVGLTIPFLIAIFASEDIAMWFGAISELLALVLGILSWKHTFGKIATVGVSILIALSGFQYIAYLNLKKHGESELMQTLELDKSKKQNKP